MPDMYPVTKDEVELQKFADSLLATFEEVEKKRRMKELEWLDALRQVKGIYDPSVLARIPEDGSKVYPKYTKSKERYIRSKINSIVFPENGKSWSISPTPQPEVSEDILLQAQEQVQVLAKQGIPITNNTLDTIINRIVAKRCAKMERTIEDQLIEANYTKVFKEVIKSGIRYGTGVWKGPLTKSERKPYNVYENNVITQKFKKRYFPTLRFVPIWFFYPDMSVSEIDDASFIYELHVMTKKDLINLSKQQGYFGDTILKYITLNPTGNYQPKNWETMLRSISDHNDLDSQFKPTVRSYQVLEYWGYVDGTYFLYAGLDTTYTDIKDSDVYEARVWLLGDKIIRMVLNPLSYSIHPYNVFYYDKDETSIFGIGLPADIKGTQEVICATARMILDNAAIVAGPQVEINTDLLDPDQDLVSIYARKIWYRTGVGIDSQYPAVRSINFDSHIQEYVQIIDVFRKIGDEESSLPSLLWSQLQNVETAKGVSIRYQTAHITLMDIIKDFDKAQENFITNMYKWNMDFNENPEIKGDFKIKAKGTDALLERESKLEAIITLFKTITEEDSPYLNRKWLLQERLKALGIDAENALLTDEEATANIERQQQQEQAMKQLEVDKIKAETEYERAKAANMLAKSKKVLTEDEISKKEFVRELQKDAESLANKTSMESVYEE